MRDERKVMLLGKHTPGKPRIHVYSSSGLPITSFTVRNLLSLLGDSLTI